MREIDTAARVGGDEFALLLLEVTDAAHAIQIIKKIMRRFEKAIEVDDLFIQVSLSIGIAMYPDDGSDSLMEKADAAMYYVKQHGKNNFKLFDKNCPYRPQTDEL